MPQQRGLGHVCRTNPFFYVTLYLYLHSYCTCVLAEAEGPAVHVLAVRGTLLSWQPMHAVQCTTALNAASAAVHS
jgi:hypothetical protein